MMTLTIPKILTLVRKHANKLESDAGFSGAHDDGGASALRKQVEAFVAGQTGTIPAEWMQLETVKLLDPEYVEYMRLREKFGR